MSNFERPRLYLVTNEISPEISWDTAPQSLIELEKITNFLPTNSELLETIHEEKLDQLITNIKAAVIEPPPAWFENLSQFKTWETIFNKISQTKQIIAELSPKFNEEFSEIQTLIVAVISKLGLRNEMSQDSNDNPAFVYLLRLLHTNPEFITAIDQEYIQKKHSPNKRTEETELSQWVEDQVIVDKIGEILNNAQSLQELLHLLTLIPYKKVTIHRTADYSTNYRIISFISFVTAELERLAISNSTNPTSVAQVQTELHKLQTLHDASQSATFPPNLGLFKTRSFIYSEIQKELQTFISQKGSLKTPDDCQTWAQLVWYSEQTIPKDKIFIFTKKEDTVEHIIRLSGGQIHAVIAQAPLDSSVLSLLPTKAELNFVKPDDQAIIGLREKLNIFFD